MSLKIFTILLLLPLIAAAAQKTQLSQNEEFQIESKKVQFVDNPQKRLRISANCIEQGAIQKVAKKCRALVVFEDPQVPNDWADRAINGMNPGSVICKHNQGQVVIGRDAKGNEMSFCYFSMDQSFIDQGSLTWASKNNLHK